MGIWNGISFDSDITVIYIIYTYNSDITRKLEFQWIGVVREDLQEAGRVEALEATCSAYVACSK